MKIIYHYLFQEALKEIVKYIAKDKKSASISFNKNLKQQIKDIPNNPLKYVKSGYFNDSNVRDMTYMGYTIIYEINFKNNSIEMLKIFNRNKLPSMKD
ncbi:type II toxin-antitoxin system RelE/ParE family toxin [Sulfurimonas sp. MAG313]|nr:type II toxin-antitoxin system RelE/ParE family toxin [Sulfurimonas sp. MAG313]MDF1881389.1 type II toxin-antitoxin system RelE/ParE family toxin [Sulfurimonas sp. MAG313]